MSGKRIKFLFPLQVLLDGVDIRTLNLHWLRRRLALVSQEPVLFNMTVIGKLSKLRVLTSGMQCSAADSHRRIFLASWSGCCLTCEQTSKLK